MSPAALMDRSGPLKARSNAARESVRDAEVNLAKVVRGHEWSCLPALRTAAKRSCFHKKKRMKEAVLQRVKGDNKRLKVALEVKEAELQRANMELQRAKMDNSLWLAADSQRLVVALWEREVELRCVKGDNKRLKVALEEKEARLKRAKMHNSCLAADCQGLKAELEETEAELQRANMDNSCLAADFQGLKAELEEKEATRAPMIVCDCEIDSDVESGLGDSENRI